MATSFDRDRQHNRRSFLKASAISSAATVLLTASSEEQIAWSMQNVNRRSKPSELRITDLRVAVLHGVPGRCPIVRIDTNQGIRGWGEVRDGASERYALFLKSRILGENPCNVERLFKRIKQFGHHARQGGGVSGVEMALWDLAGKAYEVPVYQMLGGKYRDRIRIYCDTTWSHDPHVYAKRMRERVEKGFTFLKMDMGISMLREIPDTTTRRFSTRSTRMTPHPFAGIEITDKGLDILANYAATMRQEIGYEVPLAADHFGHIGVNSCIRLGKALEPYQLAWLEDMVPWQYPKLLRQIKEAVNLPILTGEDIYLEEDFINLIEQEAVDMIHPDLATAGGILETKRIGDYAEERGVPMAMHFAGTPISFMANVHCAAATQNFVALEHHSVDIPWWEDLAIGTEKPILERGFVRVPERPGLGIELNEEVAKEHLRDGRFFEPTEEWNEPRSWDRLWS